MIGPAADTLALQTPTMCCEVHYAYSLYIKIYIFILEFNPFSAGTVFRRQNLTSTDVRRLRAVPALKNV